MNAKIIIRDGRVYARTEIRPYIGPDDLMMQLYYQQEVESQRKELPLLGASYMNECRDCKKSFLGFSHQRYCFNCNRATTFNVTEVEHEGKKYFKII